MKKLLVGAVALFVCVFLVLPLNTQAEQPDNSLSAEKVNDIITQVNLISDKLSLVSYQSNPGLLRLTRTLQIGDQGDDVLALQKFLAADTGLYPEGEVTGYFGPLTEAAIMRLQQANSIEAIGVVGPKTRAAIEELTEQGQSLSEGMAVTENGVKYKKGELLIKINPGSPSNNTERTMKRYGLSKKETIPGLGVHIITVPEGQEEVVRNALSHNPNIEFVELNQAVEPVYTPNDPEFVNQWHHQTIGSEEAWNYATTAGIVIGIADSGVDGNHPDLASRMVGGWNTVSNNTDTTDVNGHGTKVAGVAAAAGDNGIGVAGLSYQANVMPLRITNTSDGYAYWSDIAEAIQWGADNGAKIVSNSYQTCGSASVKSAANYLKGKGGLVTVSEGNYGTDTGYPDAPEMLCISATDITDTVTSWSSFGQDVDLAAPGAGIRTTTRGGGYGAVSGTSFSAPLVAGLLGLVWGTNPSLSPDQVEQIVKDTAVDKGEPGWDMYYGWGRIDAAAAVVMAANTEGPAPDITAPTVSISSPASGTTVEGVVTVTVSASDINGVDKVELLVDGVVFATDSSAPYQFVWDTANESNGSVVLSARAHDMSNNEGASDDVTVIVSNTADVTAPSVSITTPTEGMVLDARFLDMRAEASDNVGVAEISLLLDGGVVATCQNINVCEANVLAKKVKDGAHTVNAIARDARGNEQEVIVNFTKGEVDGGTDPTPTKCTPGARKKGEC